MLIIVLAMLCHILNMLCYKAKTKYLHTTETKCVLSEFYWILSYSVFTEAEHSGDRTHVSLRLNVSVNV